MKKMATALRMKFFLVVLTFGFFAPSRVNGLKCYHCDEVPCTTDQKCKNVKECLPVNGTDAACEFYKQTEPTKAFRHYCTTRHILSDGTKDSECVKSQFGQEKRFVCQCFTELCNSVGHLQFHGWNFLQLIAISFVVLIWICPFEY